MLSHAATCINITPTGHRILRWRIVYPGIEHNVLSVPVRDFEPWGTPSGVRVRHHLEFSGNPKLTLLCAVFFAVWRSCKAFSRAQWDPKTAPSRVQCAFLVFGCFATGRIHDPREKRAVYFKN